MNAEDGFEKRLRALPPRQIPEPWRKEILGALPEVTRTGPVAKAGVVDFLRALLWPSPQAWAGLGAAWLLIFGLHLASHEPGSTEAAPQLARPSPQMRELLREQEQLMAELSDRFDLSEPRKREPVVPKPQSCIQRETFNA